MPRRGQPAPLKQELDGEGSAIVQLARIAAGLTLSATFSPLLYLMIAQRRITSPGESPLQANWPQAAQVYTTRGSHPASLPHE